MARVEKVLPFYVFLYVSNDSNEPNKAREKGERTVKALGVIFL